MKRTCSFRPGVSLLTVAIMSALSAISAQAFEIPTDSDDLAIRWDNTVKYNYVYRTQAVDPAIANSFNYNDGDLNFEKGPVSKRFDLFSEFDFVYKKDTGIRLSAAAWADSAYDGAGNPGNPYPNSIVNSVRIPGLSNYSDRYFKGVSGEFLDAFVFGGMDIGNSHLDAKAGQTTVYWGESLLSPVHGVNYGQSPLDLGKLYSVPGTEAKELFRPREQLYAQLNATPTFSVAAQYFLDWNPVMFPEAGTFMGPYDMALGGGQTFINPTNPNQMFTRGQDVDPKRRGDWGLMAKWRPDWLDGTISAFARRTSDILPFLYAQPSIVAVTQLVPTLSSLPLASQVAALTQFASICGAARGTGVIPVSATVPLNTVCALTNGNAAAAPGIVSNLVGQGAIGSYGTAYANNIDIYGISLSKNIGDIAVSGDLNYRRNMPLLSNAPQIMPAAFVAAVGAKSPSTAAAMLSGFPADGNDFMARGNTWHAVVNAIASYGKTPLYDASSLVVEGVWNGLANVTSGCNLFKGDCDGRIAAPYTGVDKVTKNFYGVAINFTPTWFQVFPSIDLSMPLSYSVGVKGESAIQFGGNQGAGTYSYGVSAEIKNKYEIDLKYTDAFGKVNTCQASVPGSTTGVGPTGSACLVGQITDFAGLASLLKDRGQVALTFKTTF